MRCLPLFVSAIFGCSLLGACSSSTVPATEDDDDVLSSSSKAKNSSSSVKGEGSDSESGDVDKDCVGETGNPWDGTTAKEFACGSGTKLSPYMILTAEQLAHLSFIVGAKDKEYNGKYFKLGADIILNEGDIIDENGALVADSTKLHKWTPIGNSNVAFTGNFDGDGHSVSGVFINTTSTHNGLFGNSSGTIQNVTVENGWVKGGKYTAGIVGHSVGTVSDIQNAISVVGTDECTGGVIGNSARREYKYNSVIKNIINRGAVEGGKNVGGVAGCATYVTVNGVENIAKVDGYAYVGGTLGGIGISKENDIQNLRNSGAISGSHFVGGVAGHCGGILSVYSSGKSSISGCSNTSSYSCGTFANAMNEGNVDGVHFVGGVLGEVCGGSLKSVANTALVSGDSTIGGVAGYAGHVTSGSMYNTSDVSGKLRVGGIFGQNTEGVTNAAYSTGKVDGDTLVGLMIGYNYNTTMADYYYLEQGDQEPFGLNNGGGVATPKTAEEMKSQEFAELLGENFAYDPEMNDGYLRIGERMITTMISKIEHAITTFKYDSYLERRKKSKNNSEKRRLIAELQKKLCDYLNDLVKGVNWKLEKTFDLVNDGLNQEFKKRRDSIDIYGSSNNLVVVIEIDASRADQVAKKMLSRAYAVMNENKHVLYIALCYPGTDSMNTEECVKYFKYGSAIFKKLK